MPSQVAVTNRRRALIEASAIPRFKSEIRRYGRECELGYIESGSFGVEGAAKRHQNRVSDLLDSLYSISVSAGVSLAYQGAKSYRPSIETKQTDEDAVIQQILATFESYAFEQSVLIAETSLKEATSVVAKGLEEGLGPRQIASNLRKVQENLAPYRAEMIARTETGTALNSAQFQAVEDMDLPGEPVKMWNAANDKRTRKTHAAVEAQSMRNGGIPMDERFQVGRARLLHPNERGGRAEEVINCRCVLTFDIKEPV